MDKAVDEETDASDDEDAMETDGKSAPSDVPMETDDNERKEAATPKAKEPVAAKPAAVASGLPQSKEELESLVSTIHQSVNNNVLPRLHKCLTAKVHAACTTDT